MSNISMVPVRRQNHRRVYSNHVEIATSDLEVNIKFCDAGPPENREELKKILKENKVYIPIEAEIVIPIEVAKIVQKILNEKLKEV